MIYDDPEVKAMLRAQRVTACAVRRLNNPSILRRGAEVMVGWSLLALGALAFFL